MAGVEVLPLHRKWEREDAIRERTRQTKALLDWPPEKHLVGAPNKKSFALNKTVLERVAEWWCPQRDYPESVPVGQMREEVGVAQNTCFIFKH